MPVGSSRAGSAYGRRSANSSPPPSSWRAAPPHVELVGDLEVGDRREGDHATQRRRAVGPPRGVGGQQVPGGRPEGQVAAGGVAGEYRTAGVGPRQVLPDQLGQRVQRGGHVVERVGPTPRDGLPGTVGTGPLRPAPVLHTGHGEAPFGQEAGERADVPPVVRGAPRAAVQHHHDGSSLARARNAARRVEVDHLVGVVAVTGGGVRLDRGVGEGRFLLRRVPRGSGARFCGGVRHAQPLSDETVLADRGRKSAVGGTLSGR